MCVDLRGRLRRSAARVFLTYFTRKSAFKRFGFHPEGTIGIWKGLAAAVERDGGQVWLSTPVTEIVSADGRVTGVEVVRDGTPPVTVHAPIVISDVGPAATLTLLGADASRPITANLWPAVTGRRR